MTDTTTPVKKKDNSLLLSAAAVIIAALIAGALWYFFVRETQPLQPPAQEKPSPSAPAEDTASVAFIEGVNPLDEPEIPVAEVVIADTAREDRTVPSLAPDLLESSGAAVVHDETDIATTYEDEEEELIGDEDEEEVVQALPTPQVSAATDVAPTVPTGPETPLAFLALGALVVGAFGFLKTMKLARPS